MPRICFFKGIAVFVYYNDHRPPHVHVRYAGKWVVLSIADARILEGKIHPLALSLARDLVRLRKDELLEAWTAVAKNEKPQQVQPPYAKSKKRKLRYGSE